MTPRPSPLTFAEAKGQRARAAGDPRDANPYTNAGHARPYFLAWERGWLGHKPPRETHTDCRSPTGITVGLVDSLIVTCRVLRMRDLRDPAVREALLDLANDPDFGHLLQHCAEAAGWDRPFR